MRPPDGTRVIDLSRVPAGPCCSMLPYEVFRAADAYVTIGVANNANI